MVIFERADIRKSGERIKLLNGSTYVEKPVKYIEAVIVMGKVSLTSDAVNLLLSKGVPVFFLSKFGRLRGILCPSVLSSAVTNRIRQYRSFERNRLEIAKRIVDEKLLRIEDLYCVSLQHIRAGIRLASSVEELMGMEGKATRIMFGRFRESIEGSELSFKERRYYPPADEINALLSLSYSFAYALALPVVTFLGYDPYVSFLHSKRGTHASFCSDIIEPVRPLITKELEYPILRGLFVKKDFRKEGKGVYMKKESLPKFVNWFETVKDKVVQGIKASLLSVGECMR